MTDGSTARDIGGGAKVIGVNEAVVRGVRLGEHREAVDVLLPREHPAVYDDPAHRGAVTAHELRQRVDDDVGAVFERAQQNRRSDGIVDDQRNSVVVRDVRDCFEIANVPGGIADAFAEERSRIAIDQLLHSGRPIALGEAGGDPELRQHVRKKRMRRPVQLWDGDNIFADAGKVEDRVVERGLSAGYAERADPAFERGDAAFEYVAGWVADPAVAVALDFQVEQRRAMFRAVERVRNRLIDRNGDRLGRRIGFIATVDGNGFALKLHVLDTAAPSSVSRSWIVR